MHDADTRNVKGCRQHPETREAKWLIAEHMTRLGALITLFEPPDIGCDVLAVGRAQSLALEYQRYAKHVLPNLTRDFRSNIDGALIITPSFGVCREIAHQLSKDLPEQWVSRVGLMTLDTLRLLAGIRRPASGDVGHNPSKER
jgi:hypothetical protein